MDSLNQGLNDIRRKFELLEVAEDKDKSDFEEKIRMKNKVLEEIGGKRKDLVNIKIGKLEEIKEILENLERNKLIRPETEVKISTNTQSFINYFDEIRELQGQITEYKSLQQSCIADRHSLLEPLKYLENQYMQKSQQSLSSDLDSIISTSLKNLKSLQDPLKSPSLHLSTSLKSFTRALQSSSFKSNSTFKSQHKNLLNTLKTLILSTQKSELLLKTLDVQDRALDSFKHENCSDI